MTVALQRGFAALLGGEGDGDFDIVSAAWGYPEYLHP
jgi:hypothetical protein